MVRGYSILIGGEGKNNFKQHWLKLNLVMENGIHLTWYGMYTRKEYKGV